MDSNHQLHARGLTRSEIAALVRSRELVRLRPGAFVAPGRPESPEARHLELIEATLPHVAPDGVLSHISAAVLHDLPVPLQAMHRVHLTRNAKGRITRHTHQHEGSLPVGSVTQIKGHAVTSLTRTAADLARWLAYADAVALLDATLRRGIDRAEIELEIALVARRPGNTRARRALAFANPLAESPGESKSRVLLAELGLPTPVLQQEFRNAAGELDARTDFDWPDFGTCGEYDGKEKYGRLLRPGQDIEAAVMYEKRREGVLRDHGRWTIRWGVDELNDPAQFRRIVTTGLKFGLGSPRTS